MKNICKLHFPKKENVIKYDVYNMKQRILKINPYMRIIESTREFQIIFSASKLEIGIDNIPKTVDKLVKMSKVICWSNIISKKDYKEKFLYDH